MVEPTTNIACGAAFVICSQFTGFFVMDEEILHQIEQILGYQFKDSGLLVKAFTHSSSVCGRSESNERLEFLGDAILSMVICEALFERFGEYLEGDLTKIKSMLVSRRTCSKIVKKLDLHHYIKIGKGMTNSRSISGSLAAGLLEAIIAAIHVDGGIDEARDFILRIYRTSINKVDANHTHGNYKSVLQQHAQKVFGVTPVYDMIDEKGPDHNKCFELQAVIDNQHFSSAWGNNKKEAEQKAAYNALVELDVVEPDDDIETEISSDNSQIGV